MNQEAFAMLQSLFHGSDCIDRELIPLIFYSVNLILHYEESLRLLNLFTCVFEIFHTIRNRLFIKNKRYLFEIGK